MNLEVPSELTPEQKKEVSKIISKARINLSFIAIKFAIGLFAANFISLFVGIQFLKDVDPEMQVGFEFVSMAANFIFMAAYLNGQIKANSDIVVSKIKEVLKK